MIQRQNQGVSSGDSSVGGSTGESDSTSMSQVEQLGNSSNLVAIILSDSFSIEDLPLSERSVCDCNAAQQKLLAETICAFLLLLVIVISFAFLLFYKF